MWMTSNPGRVLRDTFTTSTDNAIEEFINAFIELKKRLHERIDLDSWKIARTMKDGVLQLSEYTEHLKEIGEVEITLFGLII
jgi:hypothetical protein